MKDVVLDLSSRTLFPVRLMEITRLDEVVFRIAEAEEDITVGANTYLALSGCEISAVKHTLGGAMPSMAVGFSHSDGGTFDTTEINAGLFDGAAVTLWIADRNNLAVGKGALPFFTGTIQPVEYGNTGLGSFDIRGQAAQAETFIQTYSPMCRTDLFSVLCGADQNAFDYHSTVATIVDRFNITITAPAEGTPADGFFNLGVGETASGVKFEIANWNAASLQLTTFLPVAVLFAAGQAITIWPGCDKTIATCRSKLNNAINFQGEPHFLGAAATQQGG